MAGYGDHYIPNVGKYKWSWTEEEDKMLVDSLMELYVSGKYVNADIEPKYVRAVKIKMMDYHPKAAFSAGPVTIRMEYMKNSLNIVPDMLIGKYMTGFSWDPERSRVIAGDQVWDEYIKTHADAARFRNQPFPHYEKLCMIFGKDKATGFQAEVVGGEEVMEENQMNPCVESKNFHIGGDALSTFGVIATTGYKRKSDEVNDFGETCVESLGEIENMINNFGRSFIKNLEKVANQRIDAGNDMMDKVMTQMKDLSGLSVDERLVAMSVIGRSSPLSHMFDKLDGDGKVRMAQMVANGSIR